MYVHPEGGTTRNNHYWYNLSEALRHPGWSYSWTVAAALYRHLTILGSAKQSASDAEKGDIIFASFTGDKTSDIEHSGVIVGMKSKDDPEIAQHSPAIITTLWHWLHNGLHNGGKVKYYWIYRPRTTARRTSYGRAKCLEHCCAGQKAADFYYAMIIDFYT
jgi:Putative amidase domain